MKMVWKGIAFLGLLGIVLLASAFPMEAAEKELKIGLMAPMTGGGAAWGLSFERVLLLRAEQYNAAGGIQVGRDKYKIKIISVDDKFSAPEAVSAINRLIFKENVKFVVGPLSSACIIAISPIINANKVITMMSAYTSKALGPDKPFIFGPIITTGEIIPLMFKHVKKIYPNIKKVGILVPNDETGWSIEAEFRLYAEKMGWEIVAGDYHERNTSDFYPVLTRALSNKPDLILMDPSTGDLGLLLKQVRQLGYKGLTLTSAGHDAEILCKISGKEAAEGHINSAYFVSPGGIQKWQDAYFARWGKGDPTTAYVSFLELMVEGIKKANSLDTEKVRVGIERVDFVSSVFGPLKLGGKNRYGIAHRLLCPVPISQIKGGENVGLALYPGEEPLPPPEPKKKN